MMGKVKSGYYKHFKGNIYRVLFEVKHTETCEDMVVYQAMYGNGDIWARPKSMFLDEDRFTKIDDHEAEKQIPLYLNPKYNFPNIEYVPELVDLMDKDSLSSPVKAMITLLSKKNIITQDFCAGFKKDDDVEKEILRRIKEYSPGDNLEEIFHLIQIWGGATGRYIYIFDGGFSWHKVSEQYTKLVDTCLSISSISDSTINKLVDAVNEFDKAVAHMGVAFITKHTRFWLNRTLGNNALPIYDSIMANCVMRKNSAEAKHLSEYWSVMIAKAQQLGIGLMPLERQIFKYAYEQR